MTARDRTVLIIVLAVAIVVGAWFLLIAPVRKDAAGLADQVTTAQTRLAAAQALVEQGESARATYKADYTAVARLGKAVPADDDVPSLLVQLEGAAKQSEIDFQSIVLSSSGASGAPVATTGAQVAALAAAQNGAPAAGTTGATGATGVTGATGATAVTQAAAAATQVAASSLPPGAVVGAAGYPTLPFDFTFNGSFFKLKDFLARVDRFTKVAGQNVTVRGRLLTVDGFSLGASSKGFPNMTASVHATAYIQPQTAAATPTTTPVSTP